MTWGPAGWDRARCCPSRGGIWESLNLEGQVEFTRLVSPLSPEQKLVWSFLERQASRGIAL